MVDIDVLGFFFLLYFVVFGLVWFVIFLGRMGGGGLSSYSFVELKCIFGIGGVLCDVKQYKIYIRSFIVPTEAC